MSTYLPIVRIITSRRENDCAICALAMLLGRDYEDVLLAVDKVDKQAGKKGLWSTQIKKAAQLLGQPLKMKRKFDLETAAGILAVDHPKGLAHALLLREGLVFDYDGLVWDVEDYLAEKGLTVSHLLVVDLDHT